MLPRSISVTTPDITALPAFRRARLGIARGFQIPRPFTGMTVFENLLVPMDYAIDGRGEHAPADGILASVGLAARRNAPAEIQKVYFR